jgi:hypothetical protein
MDTFYGAMQANNPPLSANNPAGSMENELGEAVWTSLRRVELIYNRDISIAPVLSSDSFHSSFRMSSDTTVDSLPMSNAMDQCGFWCIGRKLSMGTNVSPFLCCDFAVSSFSPNLSLPALLCSFLLLDLPIYTTLLSLLLLFLVLVQKCDFVNETSSDLIGFRKTSDIERDIWVILRAILHRSKDFEAVYIS